MTGKMKTTHHWWVDYRTGVSGVDQPIKGLPALSEGTLAGYDFEHLLKCRLTR